MTTEVNTVTETPQVHYFTKTVHALGHLMNRAAGGDRKALGSRGLAELKRLHPDHRMGSTFDHMMLWLENEGVIRTVNAYSRDGEERDWAVILQGMATCAGLHHTNRPAGTALFHCMIEPRFNRLVQAHRTQLASHVRSTASILAAHRQSVDWTQLIRLVLTDGRSAEDQARRDLARSYFHAQYHAE